MKIRKKLVMLFTLLLLIIGSTTVYIKNEIEKVDKTVPVFKEKLIRFHVIANSDSDEDQKLKLKVRDEIISYLDPMLDKSKSIEESEKIINENKEKIVEISEKVIEENKYKYNVKVELGYSNFPTKQYSNIVLPAGNYKALKVVIGEGTGKNWWCVMFPPLCFVDIDNGITGKDTENNLKKVLSEKEYNMIAEQGKTNIEDIELKFKIIEVIQKIKENNASFADNRTIGEEKEADSKEIVTQQEISMIADQVSTDIEDKELRFKIIEVIQKLKDNKTSLADNNITNEEIEDNLKNVLSKQEYNTITQ
jgi:stage II sporulation protein R